MSIKQRLADLLLRLQIDLDTADSISLVTLIVEVEEEFKVEIPISFLDVEQLKRLDYLVEVVEMLTSE